MRLSSFLLKKFQSVFGSEFLADVDNREVIKGATTTFSFKIIGLILSYIFNIIFARLYGAKILGLFALTLSLYSFLSLFAQLGLQTAVVRFISQYTSQNNGVLLKRIYFKFFKIILVISIFLSLLLILSSDLIAGKIFGKEDLSGYLKILGLILPLGVIISLNSGALRGLKRIRESVSLESLIPFFNIVFLLVLTFLLTKNYLIPIKAYAISTAIVSFVSIYWWYFSIKNYDFSKAADREFIPSFRNILNVSLPMMITSGMLFLMGWTDIIVLGIYENAELIGVYRIALKIALFTSFTLVSVNSIVAPKISELYWSDQHLRLKKMIQNATKLISWSSLLIFFFIIFFADKILYLFGPEFLAGKNVLIILAISYLFNAFCGPVGFVLNMTGEEKKFQNAIIIGALMNVVLNFILIPLWGIVGAALATGISTILWNVISSLYVHRIFGYWIFYTPAFLTRNLSKSD